MVRIQIIAYLVTRVNLEERLVGVASVMSIIMNLEALAIHVIHNGLK